EGFLSILVGQPALEAVQIRATVSGKPMRLTPGETITPERLYRWAIEHCTLAVEPAGEWAGRPFIAFAVLPGQLVVSAHDDVPRTGDGLPDLRTIGTPREHWGA